VELVVAFPIGDPHARGRPHALHRCRHGRLELGFVGCEQEHRVRRAADARGHFRRASVEHRRVARRRIHEQNSAALDEELLPKWFGRWGRLLRRRFLVGRHGAILRLREWTMPIYDDEVRAPSHQRSTPASHATRPPTRVNTLSVRDSTSTGTVKMSCDSTAMSASIPGASDSFCVSASSA